MEGVAEPQGRGTGSGATDVSDRHCPAAASQPCVDVGDGHMWIAPLEDLEPQSPSLFLLVLHGITKKKAHPCERPEASSEGWERGEGEQALPSDFLTSWFLRCGWGSEEVLMARMVSSYAPPHPTPALVWARDCLCFSEALQPSGSL